MSRLNLKTNPLYQDVFRDFEGMADAKAVLLKCRNPVVQKVGPTYKNGEIIDPEVQTINHGVKWAWDCACADSDPPELKNAVRTITLNLTYEMADTSDIENITFQGAIETAYVVREVLTCPEWSEVTDEMIEQILNSPDEEEEGEDQ